jgi:hypothetical protein
VSPLQLEDGGVAFSIGRLCSVGRSPRKLQVPGAVDSSNDRLWIEGFEELG